MNGTDLSQLAQAGPWIAAAVFVAAGGACAWLVRLGRIAGARPSAALLGGVLAGLMLGPLGLGSVDRELHERLAFGAAGERVELRAMIAELATERAALRDAGVSPEAIDELAADHDRELARPRARLAAAEQAHRRALTAALVVAATAGIGLSWAGGHRRLLQIWPGRVTGLVAASLLTTVSTAGIVGGLAWLVMDVGAEGFAAGFAVGAGALTGAIAHRWIDLRGRAGVHAWFGVAGALLGLGGVALLVPDATALAIVPVGGAILGAALRTTGAFGRRTRVAARIVLHRAAVPGLAAWLVASVDPSAALAWDGGMWFVAGCALLVGDGALLGTWSGLLLLGAPVDKRHMAHTAMQSLANTAPLGLCLLAILVGAGALETRAVGGPIVLGCVVMLLLAEPLSRMRLSAS